MHSVPERDWKLLRELTPLTLERFCARVLESATQIAASSGESSHDRYLKLYRMIMKEDEALAGAFHDHRRSTALACISRMHALGLFTEEELSRFTERTREAVIDLESIYRA